MFMNHASEIHIVPEDVVPSRLQEYGVGLFEPCATKSALKKALKRQLIKVNNSIATTATWIKGGEKIELLPPESTTTKDPGIPLKVLFEDEWLAVVHKPAGVPVSGNKLRTIANALPYNLRKSGLSDAATPQPVHRLDYPTSGLLLAGKTHTTIRLLNKLFELNKVDKTYLAINIGKMENETGSICSKVDGKPAQSDYRLLKSIYSKKFEFLNLMELKPSTGRRHQLRKHLAGLGNPILGDKLYGSDGKTLVGKGLFLHAVALEFDHPFTSEKISLQDDFPKKFKKIFPELNREKDEHCS